MKYFFLLLMGVIFCVSAAERDGRKAAFRRNDTPYIIIETQLNDEWRNKIQKHYQDWKVNGIRQFTLGERLSGAAAIGLGAVCFAGYYNLINDTLAHYYKWFGGGCLAGLGIAAFYNNRKNYFLNLPNELSEQEIRADFEQGKKNADKHIQQTCKLQ